MVRERRKRCAIFESVRLISEVHGHDDTIGELRSLHRMVRGQPAMVEHLRIARGAQTGVAVW